ncbi:ATP-binding protein [Pseudomonas aeruginosa]|nr:ATP-binding protein [Pseudomonas aeruginosa]MBV5962578.1 ATP-binding protein [Pseudomonas aeruginosa]
MATKTVHFKTNTLLKDLVGRDLINDDNIAVVELVKNSYDANSRSVTIEFHGIKNWSDRSRSKIIISDRGVGMSLDDIENKWLNIAYSEKRITPQQHGHYLAGNKGIGRFSCDRLGERLDLFTRRESGDLIHLEIEWPDFEVSDQRDRVIQDVGIRLHENPTKDIPLLFEKNADYSGTVLIISRLRSEWNYEKLGELKRALEKFINPNQAFSSEKFTIKLDIPEYTKEDQGRSSSEKINGQIKNQIFKSLEFKTSFIESEISDDGEYITTRLHHEGDLVFELQEKNSEFPLLNGITVVVYYLNAYKKSYFKRQTGTRAIDFGSIFLFLNGFRVAPYGDRGNDWLGLDIRKGQGHARYLGSRDLIGRIEIADSEEAFKPISSREGLKRTPALTQLKERYFLDVLRKLEKFVVDGLAWDSVSESAKNSIRNEEGLDWKSTKEDYSESWAKKRRRVAVMMMNIIGTSPEKALKFWFNPSLLEGLAEERSAELENLLDQLDDFDPDQVDKDLKSNIRRITKALEKKEEEVKSARADAATLRHELARKTEEIEILSDTAEAYRAQTLFLQSTGTLSADNLRAFHHQIFLESSILGNNVAKSIKMARKIPDDATQLPELIASLNKIALTNQRIIAITQFATKANFKAGTKKEPTDIPAFFEQYLKEVAPEFIASGMNLKVINHAKAPFELKSSRIELSIIIDNLISNSGKSMSRNIHVTISDIKNDKLTITFKDDGKGIPKEIHDLDSIFELGVTTTSGSGIGLHYVRNIMSSMGGKILARNNSDRGAEFEMEFTR